MHWRKLVVVALLIGVLLASSIPHVQAASVCDSAQYISDPSVPDGAAFAAGTPFTKTWRLMNIGTCTWTAGYKLVFVDGSILGAPTAVNLPVEVQPGQMVDVSVNMVAPTTAGNYVGNWKLSNAAGTLFGIGSSASDSFWVNINVVETNTVIYDFVANAPYAEWRSASGILPYPGTSGDSRGYSFPISNPRLEDDSVDTLPGLLAVPHNKFNGYIQATYPEFLVQQGDHFQSLVNCEFGATSCYVTFNLNYVTSTGSVRTFWSWREAYDKRFYRADIDLSRLAGQRVRFMLNVSSTGLASGDRALWGAPRIIRAGSIQPPAPPPTLTPLPALTPTPTPFLTPPPPSPAACERASFVADITVPDGTIFAPNAAFTKTWRLKNTGTCAWQTSYNFVFYSGSQMSAPTVLQLPRAVAPGQTVDLALNMVAPPLAGVYRGNWILQNASGALFGIGRNATNPVWVEIRVAGEASQENGYDFVTNACSAYWTTGIAIGQGVSACPGMYGDLSGFILPVSAPKLEDGSIGTSGLLAAPQSKFNGIIQGFYPTFTVHPGDRFQSTVGCEYGTSCYVTFRLDYMTATGSISNFWSWREQNEGSFYNANVDLTPLAGRSVRFILTVFSSGSPANDRVIWGAPRIVRAGALPIPTTVTPSQTPTSTPTATPTAVPVNWLTLLNPTYGFQLRYPADAQKVNGSNDNYTRINLPFQAGTNLVEKYLEVIVVQNAATCRSPLATSSIVNTSENVNVNGLIFLKETGGDGGVGHLHQWIAYSIARGNTCVSLDFVLHSLNPGNFPTPPPVFDMAAESAVFQNIVSTFAWLAPPPGNNWLTYTNSKYAFQFKYPAEGQLSVPDDNHAHITLPIAPGTNLSEKYLDLVVVENAATCHSPVQMAPPPMGTSETVTINGLAFLKETSVEAAVGNHYNLVVYSIPQGSTCISFVFILHSIAAGNVDPPLPEFDMGAETAVFQSILSTFTWLTPPPTNNWLTYNNSKYGFQLTYPPEGQITVTDEGHATITLPFAAGTNLKEKYLNIGVVENSTTCVTPADGSTLPATSEVVVINGITFLKQTSEDRGMGHIHQLIGYSTGQGSLCVSLNFILHSTNPDNYPTPPPVFDFAAESAVFEKIVSTFAWSPITPTPTPAFSTTLTAVVDALNTQNFDAAKGLMDQVFGFGFWGSEGTSTTPDLAIQQLQNSYIGANTHLVPDPTKDLVALLGGSNPYTVMGLDPTKSQALFVSGWGLDGKGEAILFVTLRADNSVYWHSVLIAPNGFIPQTSLQGPYAVTLIAQNDMLNIRSGAGASNPIVGSFAWNATNVMRTGEITQVGSEFWTEVVRPDGGFGWVNFNYLTEYVTSAAFCADARVPSRIDQLKQAVTQSNGSLFASLVGRKHGAAINYWRNVPPVTYTSDTAGTIFTDTTVYNWGTGPDAGPAPVTGTFAQIVQPDMAAVFNSNYLLVCDDPSYASMFPNAWPYNNIHYYAVVKPPTSGIVFDWKVWLIGFEYLAGQPYMYGTVHYVWDV